MIKTFEQFSKSQPNPTYTQEEYDNVLSIVSEYYDENDPDAYDCDSIEEFIYSSDIEAKEDFIESNEIETLRVCQHCGKFMNEGYIYRDFETFCSDECFIKEHGRATFENADEDELYWTAWEG
jgi:hypothetical protein